jgi:Xaa-Pro aminopeptidase
VLAPAPGEDAASAQSLERPGDGSPVCGLGKEFHGGRRAELRKRLKEGLVLLRGLPETRDYVRFTQDKVFWYLTGIETPDATLLMDAESGAEILFLPESRPPKEQWEGELWDAEDAWVAALTGIEDVRPESELDSVLKERIVEDGLVWISTAPHVALSGGYDRAGPYDRHRERDALDGRTSREQALLRKLQELYGAKVRECTSHVNDMRHVKTAEEQAAMRRAARAGALAIAEGIRSTQPGVGEWELEALMAFAQIREGAAGQAYHAIVGTGANSNVLHYSANSRRAKAGEVVLVDFGPEVDHYTTDITRTWPADGVFSARAAELYDAVLAAQKAGIAAVKPGKKLKDVDAACSAVLKERGFLDLRVHGACHWIGLEVHDPEGGDGTIVPGSAFTVEPGLYDTKAGIGIRIEDVVIATETGCEVITGLVPKERAEIEALVAEIGMLERGETGVR